MHTHEQNWVSIAISSYSSAHVWTALEHTSDDFLLQQVQGPGASRELAEFSALEFLGPNKLRRQCPASGTEAGSFGLGKGGCSEQDGGAMA